MNHRFTIRLLTISILIGVFLMTPCSVWAQKGACGINNGRAFSSLTLTEEGLCATGTVHHFKGSGPWTWDCKGKGKGTTVSCKASYTNDNHAFCGTADGGFYNAQQIQTLVSKSPASFCAAGKLGSPGFPGVQGGGSSNLWYWYCRNGSGNDYQYCNATNTVIDGACGTDAGLTFPSADKGPSNNLCYNKKSTASALEFNAPEKVWRWTCKGIGGGANSPLCQAYLCGTCQGTKTEKITTVEGNTTEDGCAIGAEVTWSETDALSSIPVLTTYTLSWSDLLGAHSNDIMTSPATFCKPCFANYSSATIPTITIKSVSGNCSHHKVGDNLPISSFKAQ